MSLSVLSGPFWSHIFSPLEAEGGLSWISCCVQCLDVVQLVADCVLLLAVAVFVHILQVFFYLI